MSAADNKARSRHFRERMDQTKGAGVAEFTTPNVMMHIAGGPPMNQEEALAVLGQFYTAFPDLHHTFAEQVAEGDKVALHFTLHGTHQGEFQGIPPTGKTVALQVIGLDRFEDGKLAEHWAVMDMLGLMQQLGVIPNPGQAPA